MPGPNPLPRPSGTPSPSNGEGEKLCVNNDISKRVTPLSTVFFEQPVGEGRVDGDYPSHPPRKLTATTQAETQGVEYFEPNPTNATSCLRMRLGFDEDLFARLFFIIYAV